MSALFVRRADAGCPGGARGGSGGRTRLHTRLSALIAALMLILTGGAPRAEAGIEPMRVTLIDVGKGDCILIECGEGRVLIDAGYANTSRAVLGFLSARGIESLDLMIITHYDKDHVGGAADIAQALPIGRILLPGYEAESKHYGALMTVIGALDLNAARVAEDMSFSIGGVDYTVFASTVPYRPGDGDDEGNDNDVSLVIAARHGADSYLFAGDLERDGISAYLQAAHGPFDVVKMPHHGKKGKNSDALIADIAPRIALITDSASDPASNKVLGMLDAAGAAVYRTAERGWIQVTSDGEGHYDVQTER